jgi:ATP-binding cassette subfamily B protein
MGAGLVSGPKARDASGTLRRLWRYLAVHRWALVATALAVAVSALSAAYGTLLLGRAIDQFILLGDLPGLARMILLMLGLYLLGALATWLQSWIMAQVSQATIYTLRQDLFHKLQSLSLRFFDQRTHGELMSRLTNDVENISMVLSQGATQLISSALTLVSVAAMMLALNWRLALVTMVIIPVMVIITRWLSQYTRRGFRAQQESLGEINGIIEETITAERVVKAYAREQEAIAAFEETNQKLRKASTFAQSFAGLLGPITNMVNNLGMAVVGAVGSWMAVGGMATVGTIASFVNYSRQFGMPLNQLAGLFNMLQSALAGAERVFDILDEQPEVEDAADARPLATVYGDVVFDDVCFGYEPGVPVLKHVSLHAEPGQTVALVGPTGAGKTTIINLLTRFYDIDSGSICIDERDIRSLPKDDLRRMLGIVLQDTFLFAGTVMDNIRYGRLDATDEEVLAAAHLANADHFITRLPEGYQTHLSERANNLSQGQRQLLAIARAMLADPSILILDEATSSVDTRTEVHIQEALLKLMVGRTSFVIAHRLSTIRGANIILVINEGELIERGTHEELLAQRGFYHHLYMSQFKGKVVEQVV